ncbi:igE-binding protein-like [Montipora foliosa]|uniref:igE-binding protein-like n=1 Tax=Montipora foliosa TaxID=591990 RepID=UPI0035F195C8
MTSARAVTSLKKHCARYGIPRMIVSDGGPQFTSQEFKLFVDNWGITNIASSPMHHRANGRAESAVKIMKTLLVKTYKEGGDPYEAMLEQRNTPRQDTGRSPAEMTFNARNGSF